MKLLYIIIVVLLIIIISVVFFIVLKQRRYKVLRNKLEELERQRNLIVATPIPSELDKIKVIVNNEQLEDKYKDWNKRYDVIKNQRYGEITDKLLEVDNLIGEFVLVVEGNKENINLSSTK